MLKYNAVLLEDDVRQAAAVGDILSKEGFSVERFSSADSALSALRTEGSLDQVDLFVLDRRIPFDGYSVPTEEYGDYVFDEVCSRFPDSKIVVFSGWLDITRVVDIANTGRGLVKVGQWDISRISVFPKDSANEFRDEIRNYGEFLRSLDRIEVNPSGATSLMPAVRSRILRRVGIEYCASSIVASHLSGGLSGAEVWDCAFYDSTGLIAHVVIKDEFGDVVSGGLSSILSASLSTPTVKVVYGAMFGRAVSVMQYAGEHAIPLMKVLLDSPADASAAVGIVSRHLVGLPGTRTIRSFRDLVRPVIDWNDLSILCGQFGIDTPDPGLQITVTEGQCHGDLHLDNILWVDGMPVLIDFDGPVVASKLLDPITLLLCTLCHPTSPIRGDSWPTVDKIRESFGSDDFGLDTKFAEWFRSVNDICRQALTSEREFWALTFCYCVRRLKYADILSDWQTKSRVLALCETASLRVI